MKKRHSAEEALIAVTKANAEMGGRTDPHSQNLFVASNVLKEELGLYDDYHQPDYDLDKATADVLLAHARQDAAHALSNTASILEVLSSIRTQLRIGLVLLFLLVLGTAMVVWRIW
jgi:hypothetical protein